MRESGAEHDTKGNVSTRSLAQGGDSGRTFALSGAIPKIDDVGSRKKDRVHGAQIVDKNQLSI